MDFFMLRIGRLTTGKKKYFLFLLISFVVLSVFWFLRSKKLWGDGEGTISLLENTLATNFWKTFYWREPLDRLITILVYKLLHATLQWGAWKSIALISCVGGGLYILSLLLTCDRLVPNPAGKLIIFLFMITMGKVELFFGHIENYTLVAAGTMAYLLFSVLYLQKKVSLSIPIITLSIITCIHPLSLTLSPSLVYLLWLELKKQSPVRRIKFIIQAAITFVAPILILVGTCMLLGGPKLGIGFNQFDRHPQLFLPLRYIVNPLHLKDIINEHILISPVGLFTIAFVLIFCLRKIDFRDKKLIFLIVASISFVIFTLAFHSTWEQKRDWDVLSTAATPYTLLAGYLVVSTIRPEKYLRYISLVLITVAFLNTAPWILSNSFSLSEYPEDYLRYHQGGVRLAHQGDYKRAIEYFNHALAINPEFAPSLISLGAVYQTQGNSANAEQAFKRITNLYFSGRLTREAHYNLGVIYASRGQYDPSLRHLHRVIAMDPSYPQAQALITNLRMGVIGKSRY